MIQALVFIVALIYAAPAIAQPLPAGLDKQNAIVVDTSKGRIVFKLRSDLAPQHAERIKQLAREGYYNNVPFKRGIIGMARRGDSVDTANSQFLFMFGDAPSLNGQYTVVGEVVSGMDVVDKLKKAPPGSSGGTVTDPDKMLKVQVASDAK